MKQQSVWVLELPDALYLSTVVSHDGPIGFTNDFFEAWHFPTQGTAELVRVLLNGALGARVIEHICIG